ncbi:GNAT family N-acetyltransferase [Algirhabdus cladophorae]|uniref:GNAT family N-acetyltransferase n=1 Tax=Algirhabdus cladophorae TaxID=3377108 RepID=UPI003B847492
MISRTPRAEKDQTAADLEAHLLADLAQINVQSHNESIVLERRDPAGVLIAGLTADTSYGWVLIKIIWVAQHYRGQGLGRDLMRSAEEHARALGCHAAWLETSNPAAPAFYQSLGYSEFGLLENAPDQTPEDHKRWFMRKTL